MLDHKRIIDNAKAKLSLKDSFLSYILSRFEIILTEDLIDTAATNGKIIYFNKNFLETLSIDQVVFVLLHELLHIVLKHLSRKKKRNHLIFNMACDIVVNDILIYSGYKHGQLNLVIGEIYGISGIYNTVEEVYDRLKNSDIEVITNHIYWTENNGNFIDNVLKEASEKGFRPKSRYLSDEINNVERKTKTNWKDILKHIINVNNKDYSFDKIDYRYSDILLPAFIENEESLENVWVLVDVSGSMIKEEIKETFVEIKSIVNSFSNTELYLSFFSTIVSKPKKIINNRVLEEAYKDIKSTGGTRFDIIFDYLNNLDKYPIAIIILTDGYARFPSKEKTKNIPVFWALNNKEVDIPFGYKIYI